MYKYSQEIWRISEKELVVLRKSILVLATAFAVGSAVVSTSAFAFGPLPLGGPYPLGGPHFSGPPHFGGGLHFGGPLGGGHFRGGYSERFAGHYGGSHDRRWGRYALGQGGTPRAAM